MRTASCLLLAFLTSCVVTSEPAHQQTTPPPPPPERVPAHPGGDTATTPPAPAAARNDHLIEARRAGPVRLGMTAGEISALGGLTVKDHTFHMEGEAYPGLQIHEDGAHVMDVLLSDGRASRIRVAGGQYKTPEGAHVGMRLADLADIYGETRPVPWAERDRGYCVLWRTAPGLSFCYTLPRAPKGTQIAANPLIEVILIHGQTPDAPAGLEGTVRHRAMCTRMMCSKTNPCCNRCGLTILFTPASGLHAGKELEVRGHACKADGCGKVVAGCALPEGEMTLPAGARIDCTASGPCFVVL